MKKLLIVDDEFIFRQGLRYMTDWENCGYEIVGEAANGKEALELMEKIKVDLILCDVVMPVMDGVEMVRQLGMLQKSPKVVMLSNFDEFDKVRKAFTYGAVDYLLKSKVEKEELLDCFERALPEYTKSGETVIQSFTAIVRRALDGYERQSFQELEHYLKERMKHPIYTMLFFENPKAVAKTELELKEIIQQLLPNHGVRTAFTTQDNAIALINWESLPTEEAVNFLHKLNQKFYDCPSVLSAEFTDITSFKIVAEKLSVLSKNSIFYKDRSCFWEKELTLEETELVFDQESYFKVVEVGDWQGANVRLMEFIQLACSSQGISPYSFKNFLENIIYQTMRQAKKATVDTETFDRIELRLFKDMDRAYNRVHIEQLVGDFFENISKICTSSIQQESTIIRFIKDFIEKNYAEAITLNDIAEHLHLNYSYLSYYINQNSRLSFNELVNETRIKYAKKLLCETDSSMSNISGAIGYADQSYFGKVFKKQVGVTPLQYRNRAWGHTNG